MASELTNKTDPYLLLRDRRVPWILWSWAFLGTLAVHFFLFLFLPKNLGVFAKSPQAYSREFEILLGEEPEPEVEEEYVPTNPDALENEPDDTNLFASRSTQAADTIESEEDTDDALAPAVDGESEEFKQIVEGALVDPSPPAPQPSQQQQAQAGNQAEPLPEQPYEVDAEVYSDELKIAKPSRPIAIRDEAESEEGARAFPEVPENPVEEDMEKPQDEEELDVEEYADASEFPRYNPETTVDPMVPPQQATPQQPVARKPQPRVPRTVTSPLKLSMSGTTRLAQTASYSAKFSEYGEYLDRLFESIELEWYRLNSMYQLTERRTRVTIAFMLNQYGEVIDYKIVDTTASLQAQHICGAAITNRAPFGEWSDAMKKALNDPEQIVLNFLYY